MFFFTKGEWKVGFRLIYALANILTPGRSPGCGNYIELNAKKRPSRVAVYFEDRRLTYAELNALSNKIANFFSSLGAVKGDTVALLMENCPEFLAVVGGLSKLGVVTSLINTNLRLKALSHAFKICNPKWAIVGANLIPAVEEIMGQMPVDKDKIFVWDGGPPNGYERKSLDTLLRDISEANPRNKHRPRLNDHTINIYTSGTTGLPKAAKVSNRRWFFTGWALGFSLAKLSPEDVVYTPLPLYHSIGMFVGWGGALVAGAGFGIRRKFSASEFWKEAKKFNATLATFIGEMPRFLLNQPPSVQEKDHSIRRCITVGLRANIWEEFSKRFGIEQVYEFYGATETNVGIMNADGRPGYIGRLLPLQGLIVKWDTQREDFVRDEKGRCIICKPGECGVLLGRSISFLGYDGYLDDKESEGKLVRGVRYKWDKFFNTGDMVKLHEDRWVSFVDRLGDTFRWKGENVSTKEVENILDGYPSLTDINVYGVEVPGQEGRAGMASAVFGDDLDLEDFSRFVVDNLPHYARPLFLRKCREMPTTVTLKHVKYTLREEGFNPAVVKEPLYFWDRNQEKYIPLNEDLYADIVAGNIRL